MTHIPRIIIQIERSRIYGRKLLYGISKYIKIRDEPWIILREPLLYRKDIKRSKDWYKRVKADGVIAHVSTAAQARKLVELDIPVVLNTIEEPNFRYPTIINESERIGEMAAEYFLYKGFRNFGYCGISQYHWSREREIGFRNSLKKVDIQPYVFDTASIKQHITWEEEQKHISDWLTSLPKPIAIFACNDDMGLQVLESCRLCNLIVPEEIAVLGADNDELLCETVYPPLSSIVSNVEKGGYEAAALLDRLMAGEPMQDQTILLQPTHIVTRHSTDITSIANSNVAKAVSFIHNNFRKNISIDDVVKISSMSRRSLQTEFRREIRKTIHDYIRNVRLKYIEKLLIETNLPINMIALKFDFPDDKRIYRMFQKENGMTPLEFRNQYLIPFSPV